ncbi:YXWGXW repeat-containing protein [Undibacterium sp. Jales W-56]|uniref:YXWGXW repeat-containing protein n=1 Tax=Undibacterium sp. Jales W-56 TaxID=2897325 RepID=UPI0021CF9983|nr:YXWGXW repeat-containing protein [Undibacterium sp. Jales W-56]MCU6433848.1 YXWGXW repeat-containing protein [Undibacterium sp. Jales W-56]
MKKMILATGLASTMLSACVTAPPPSPRIVYVQRAPDSTTYTLPAPQSVVSVYVEPPIYQPPPVRVAWAPPPMLVELPPPQPYEEAVWTGGYWIWEGNWVWAHGRWAPPPRPGYAWIHPYYENRGDSVIFVNGFWAAPGVHFVAPPPSLNIAFASVNIGVVMGPRPIGPIGCFVPPPPGSRFGLVIPAPIGTPPAVVTSAPPVIREGMRINMNNVSNTTIINNVSNIKNVTIVAPAFATLNGQAVNSSVPNQAHLAAKISPVVNSMAPEPLSTKPVSTYAQGRDRFSPNTARPIYEQEVTGFMRERAAEQIHPNVITTPSQQQGVVQPAMNPAPLNIQSSQNNKMPTDQFQQDRRTYIQNQAENGRIQGNAYSSQNRAPFEHTPESIKQAPQPIVSPAGTQQPLNRNDIHPANSASISSKPIPHSQSDEPKEEKKRTERDRREHER